MHARNPAIDHLDICDGRLLVYLSTARIGTARIGPSHRIVSGDRPRRMEECANDRGLVPPATQIDFGDGLFYEFGTNDLGIYTEVFVDLGALALGAQRRRGMGHCKMAALRIEQIEIEATS